MAKVKWAAFLGFSGMATVLENCRRHGKPLLCGGQNTYRKLSMKSSGGELILGGFSMLGGVRDFSFLPPHF